MQISIYGVLLGESMQVYGLLSNAVYKASPKPHWTFGGKTKASFMHIRNRLPERSGVLRYFCRDNAEVMSGDSSEELSKKCGIEPKLCRSVTCITSSRSKVGEMLDGFHVVTAVESGDKVTCAEAFSSQWLVGNVDVREAEWNDEYFRQLEKFPFLQAS